MSKWLKSFEITFWTLFLVIGIIFAFLSFINLNLFLGFAIGSLTSYVLFKITALSYFKLLHTKKKLYFIFVMLKMMLFFILLISLLFAIRAINITHLVDKNTSWVYGRINIIVFSFSLSLSALALLLHNLVNKFKRLNIFRRVYG